MLVCVLTNGQQVGPIRPRPPATSPTQNCLMQMSRNYSLPTKRHSSARAVYSSIFHFPNRRMVIIEFSTRDSPRTASFIRMRQLAEFLSNFQKLTPTEGAIRTKFEFEKKIKRPIDNR